jgi:tetratricopeptide (TPR) repeat protein
VLGERNPLVAQCLFHIAWLLTEEGGFEEAETLFRQSIAIRESIPDGERDLAIARMGLAALLIDINRFVEALPLILSALRVQLTEQGMDESVKALMLFQQGVAFRGLKMARPAERALRDSLTIAVNGLGKDHPYPAFILFTLAGTLDDQGRADEAERYYRECLELVRRTIGMGYPRAIYLVSEYGRFLERNRRRADAAALYAELVEGRRRRYPAGHQMIADGLVHQAGFLFKADPASTEPALREALSIYARHPGYRSVARLDCYEYMAEILFIRKSYEESEATGRRALELVSLLPASAFFDRADVKAWTLSRLGCNLVHLGRWPEAEAAFGEALRIYGSEVKPANRWNGFLALDGLSLLRRRQGRPAEAAALTADRRLHCRGNPDRLFAIAIDLARCVSMILQAGPPTRDRDQACRAYGDLAMEVLAEAARAGFKDLARLRNDRALDPLLDRPDYRAFVDDLPFPDRPFAR